MPKPFSFKELMARCRALLRRKLSLGDNMLFNGPLDPNRLERSVRVQDRGVELTAKEFGLLEQLMLANGRCCSREELLKTVIQSASPSTNAVDVYITYSRKKLAPATDCEIPMIPIESLRRAGYRLARVGNLFVSSEHCHISCC